MKNYKGLVLLIITVILFSTFEVTCKLIGTRLHPLQISLFRFLIGGITLLPFAIITMKKKKIGLSLKLFLDMTVLGFVNIIISMGLIQFGLLYSNASTSAVIFSTNPVFVAIFASIILKEQLDKSKTAGMVVGLAGVVILFIDKLDLKSMSGIGPILVLFSAIFFAFYTVLGKRLTLKGMDSLVMTSFSFIAGSILLLPIMLIVRVPICANTSNITPHILYLGIVVSGIAYMCYFYGLENVNTSTGSLVYFVKPALASLFSVLMLHEKLNINFYTGTGIILLSLVIVNYKMFSVFYKA